MLSGTSAGSGRLGDRPYELMPARSHEPDVGEVLDGVSWPRKRRAPRSTCMMRELPRSWAEASWWSSSTSVVASGMGRVVMDGRVRDTESATAAAEGSRGVSRMSQSPFSTTSKYMSPPSAAADASSPPAKGVGSDGRRPARSLGTRLREWEGLARSGSSVTVWMGSSMTDRGVERAPSGSASKKTSVDPRPMSAGGGIEDTGTSCRVCDLCCAAIASPLSTRRGCNGGDGGAVRGMGRTGDGGALRRIGGGSSGATGGGRGMRTFGSGPATGGCSMFMKPSRDVLLRSILSTHSSDTRQQAHAVAIIDATVTNSTYAVHRWAPR
mmetsp:Transcript_40561/g.115616  ORF Transcript_40561/g.115616 Transcript_40561/m.115616 type:complete len:325 (+) Transcript_40561:2385-3359(+)